MRIRHLPDNLVNQIAAGEVIERPAAAVKELVENAIDAKATSIAVDIRQGGKSFLSVRDNGHGMDKDELSAALDRHATSKLQGSDLLNIATMGFRGEALPSIASVARLNMVSGTQNNDTAWEIQSHGGEKSTVKPAAPQTGTTITIRDLFYATPARLKFLKSDRAEAMAVKDTLLRLAMATPYIAWTYTVDGKQSFHHPAVLSMRDRIANVLGKEFGENMFELDTDREGIKIQGLAALPTYNRKTPQHQYMFINGRPVKDRLINGCVRAAYRDVLPRDRHAVAVLSLTLPYENVDVNVHPAKTEVRFEDPGMIRGLIISALKHGIHENGFQTASTLSMASLGKFQSNEKASHALPLSRPSSPHHAAHYTYDTPKPYYSARGLSEAVQSAYAPHSQDNTALKHEYDTERNEIDLPLGVPRAHVHENYIISQTDDGIVLVDAHAAHERLVYEKLKAQLETQRISSQGLLTPDIIECESDQAGHILEHKETLAQYGLDIEAFGTDTIAVHAIPALLVGKIDVKSMIIDIADQLTESDNSDILETKILYVLATQACHGSIRSGRRLNIDEMDALLRQMEDTPLSGQCNHGRPTYITLSLKDIESLFERA